MRRAARLAWMGAGAVVLAFAGVHAWRFHRAQELVGEARAFSTHPAEARTRWLVAGDSTAVGVGASRPEDSVAGRIAAANPGVVIANVGRSGAKYDEVAAQLARIHHPYDVVLVQAGGNEALSLRDLDEVEGDLRAVLAHARRIAPRVVFMPAGNEGNSPMFLWPLAAAIKHRARALYAMESRVAREHDVVFVDLFAPEADDPFMRDPGRFFARDGLHPSSEGYRLWYEALAPHVAGT